MPITKLTPENNYPYTQERLKALEQAVPEAFADGKINWDTLREVLGEDLEEDGCEEYFGLNWPGKREARKRAAAPSRATLVPAPGEGVNEDTTENLFIEGDNLEVLKLLQKSYAGKIKMIYIDPPYNTGNDFIYNDNFTDPLEAYLAYTGATGESGELLTTNTRADGRFHSKWLNMMYPRLILARRLLREDGVIFVSIDDNEIQNLRQIMAEIFGEENTLITFCWRRTDNQSNIGNFARVKEYIVCCAKNKDQAVFSKMELTNLAINEYRYEDDKGKFRRMNLIDKTRGRYTYDLVTPNGKVINGPWMVEEVELHELIDKGGVYWANGETPHGKLYLHDTEGQITSDWLDKEFGTNQRGSDEINRLFNTRVFDFPKPTKLIEHLIRISNSANGIILDFFAGSCTTAHATFNINMKDNGNRHFIMVQVPEKSGRDDYSTISEIGKERIRRVIREIEEERIRETAKTPILDEIPSQIDYNFKVFKYSRSNLKNWKPLHNESIEVLAPLFENMSDPLVPGWKKENLLNEILLLEGLPLTSKITYLEDHLKNEVYRVSAPDWCAHDLYICLDETIQPNTVDLLTMAKEDIFVCLDSALTDELKTRLQDQFNVHVI